MKWTKFFGMAVLTLAMVGCSAINNQAIAPAPTTSDETNTAAPAVASASATTTASSSQTAPVSAAEPAVAAVIQPAAAVAQAVASGEEAVQVPTAPASGANTSLWDVIRQGFTMNHYYNNPQVQQYIAEYTHNPTFMENMATQATPYLYIIVHDIQADNLPMELALLPIVESGFKPKADSYAGAVGIWQLMPVAAERFNVGHDNFWYHGRENVDVSTKAALTYLSYLYNFFNGDWYLALAAYNSGEGTVQRSMKRNTARGLPTDFWSLSLPEATEGYVPRLLALAIIINDPARYGITLPPIPDHPLVSNVVIPRQMSLAQAAKFAELNPQELKALNPAYIQGVTPPSKYGTYYLTLPVNKVLTFEQNCSLSTATGLGSYNYGSTPLSSVGTYRVRPGDSLSTVSRFTGASIRTLQDYNHLRGNFIYAGQLLRYPVNVSSAYQFVTYRVRPGDTLSSIARKHGVSLFDLMQWNGLNDHSTLRVDQPLVIHTKVTY